MGNENKRVDVCVYKNTQIQVDADGVFYGKPEGAIKERVSTKLRTIQYEIDDFFMHKTRRKPCKVAIRFWDKASGLVWNADYIGPRSKGTSTHSRGHAFKLSDQSNWSLSAYALNMYLVPLAITPEQIKELVDAYAAVEKAKIDFNSLGESLCTEVKLPSVPYHPDAERVQKVQDETIKLMLDTMSGNPVVEAV